MEDPDLDSLTKRFFADGITSIEADIHAYPSADKQRLKVLDSIRQATDAVYIENQCLDRMHEVYEACIVESLAVAGDDESLVQYANATSYNLAANLADCWSDAEEPRTTKHFTAGVDAAKRCLDLRVTLDKPPIAMAMAYFILGVHEYSLQNYSAAELAWSKKLENEFLGFEEPSQATTDLNVLLSHGLIGLARWSQGKENDSQYEQSLRQLEAERTAEKLNELQRIAGKSISSLMS